jgi:hypothetical protein
MPSRIQRQRSRGWRQPINAIKLADRLNGENPQSRATGQVFFDFDSLLKGIETGTGEGCVEETLDTNQ